MFLDELTGTKLCQIRRGIYPFVIRIYDRLQTYPIVFGQRPHTETKEKGVQGWVVFE